MAKTKKKTKKKAAKKVIASARSPHDQVMDALDAAGRDLTKEDWAELLGECKDSIGVRLEAVEQELADLAEADPEADA